MRLPCLTRAPTQVGLGGEGGRGHRKVWEEALLSCKKVGACPRPAICIVGGPAICIFDMCAVLLLRYQVPLQQGLTALRCCWEVLNTG